ncbi:peroxide stress protein YaaA [Gorillibacterium sp. sgz500922]|uniref:peroxide stress protein YaaA n=1 Tax=Gorillibacterium sp. sgz500922 TaxID=3446694 RepID=UPI003F66C6FD
MRILISPAKKMKTDNEMMAYRRLPQFLSESNVLLALVRQMDYAEAKSLWNCNDAIATLNVERFRTMDLTRGLTPALFAYEGLQYQHMAPGVFETRELDYVERHLRILSGFYGLLRPFDGVVPYRLEMQAKLAGPGFRSLYAFWNRKLADQLQSESDCLVNLASKEYSKCIAPYLGEKTRMVTCVFGQSVNGKVVEKGTQVKMARGEMVRFMAERQIGSVEGIRAFDRLNYRFAEERSDECTYVFLQECG